VFLSAHSAKLREGYPTELTSFLRVIYLFYGIKFVFRSCRQLLFLSCLCVTPFPIGSRLACIHHIRTLPPTMLPDITLPHDSGRPLISPELLQRFFFSRRHSRQFWRCPLNPNPQSLPFSRPHVHVPEAARPSDESHRDRPLPFLFFLDPARLSFYHVRCSVKPGPFFTLCFCLARPEL